MKIGAWHDAKIASDPEYAAAVKLVEIEETIADTVVALRVKLNLSQADVAQLAGTTQATISHLENGDSNSRMSTVSRIVGALLSEVAKRSTGPTKPVAASYKVADR